MNHEYNGYAIVGSNQYKFKGTRDEVLSQIRETLIHVGVDHRLAERMKLNVAASGLVTVNGISSGMSI